MPDPDMFETPDSPPPPAYDFSQQEFDQKVAHALEASQSDQQQQRSTVDDGEDEWEVWDEAAFAAAAGLLNISETQSGSSHLPADVPPSASGSSSAPKTDDLNASSADSTPISRTQPLRISKKKSLRPKERPNWYAEAQLDETPPAAAESESSGSGWNSVASNQLQEEPRSPYPPSREATPPPAFAEFGPDYDGPPYEPNEPGDQPTVILNYVPGDSNPPSPLASPTLLPSGHDTFPPPASPTSQSHTHRRALPRPPSQVFSVPINTVPPPAQPAPIPNRSAHQKEPSLSNFNLRYGHARVAFNPQLAYSTERSHIERSDDVPLLPQKINAGAFYNSAVASLYASSRIGSGLQPSVSNRPAMYSRPSVSQASLLVSHPPASPPPQGIGGYATGRTSPAPSIQSNYLQEYATNRLSQAHASQSSIHLPNNQSTTYQPTSFQATSYQPTAYQATSYQPTSYQSTTPRPITPQPTSYQPTSYQPTSYQPTSYQPTTYSGPQANGSGQSVAGRQW